MTDPLYRELSDFYWLYSTKKDYDKEVEFLSYIFDKYMTSGKDILDVGCGQGDHMYLLQKKGYNVFGIDESKLQIEKAKKRFQKLNVENADFLKYTHHRKYDGIIMLWNTILYFSPPEKLIDVFDMIKKSLKPNGIFVFDFKSFSNLILLKRFKASLERELRKNDYLMKLDTRNTIENNKEILVEHTKSKVYYKDRLLIEHDHRPVELNILGLSQVESMLKLAGISTVEIFDNAAFYRNNPNIRINPDTEGYIVISKNGNL